METTDPTFNDCDVLIAIGMRFDDRVTGNLDGYAKQAKVIHFEIDPSEVDKKCKTEVAVLADVRESLTALLPFIEGKTHESWHKFKELYEIELEAVINEELKPKKEFQWVKLLK
jgi:acetolactate synthase-1/2/3 large subunit